MKTPSLGALAAGLASLTVLVLIAVGAPSGRTPPAAVATSTPTGPATVSGRGVSLVSTSVDFPVDEQPYPAGPHADVISANCTSCHSPGMVLNQPALSAEQWKTEVTKMRVVYKAPVAENEVPAVIDYLVSMRHQNEVPPTDNSPFPEPKAR